MFQSIVHVTPAVFGPHGVFGGAERYVDSVARAIEAAYPGRFRQTILGFTEGERVVSASGNIRTVVARTDHFTENRMDWYGREVWSVIAEHDVVHVHQAFTVCGEVALITAAESGKTCIATDLGGRFAPGNLRDHPVALSDRILAISQFSADLIGPHPPRPVDVILGPVDQRFLDRPLPVMRGKGALFVGRILPHKGIDRLIRASPANLPVTIAGHSSDPDYRRHLESLATGKDVRFVEAPDDDELLSLHASAAIHVAPSVQHDYRGRFFPNSELMGITTMEALASGTPVAVANTCSLPELIGAAPVGACFDNEDQLADILRRVVSGSWSREHDPATCRAFAAERYAPRVVGTKIVDVYAKAHAQH